MRASDDERQEAIGLLHGHLLAGRLSPEELEDRIGEVWAARTHADLDHALRELPSRRTPAPAIVPSTFVPTGTGTGGATTGVVLGVMGLGALVFSLGLLAMIALPLSSAGWIVGRGASRRGLAPGLATTAQVLGIIGTVLSCVVLGSWLLALVLILG